MATLTLNWFDLLVLAIATWRVANMLTRENGPWDIFVKLREKAPLGGLTGCIQCMSVWAAIVLLVVYWLMPVIVYPLAISGAALMLKSYTGASHDV